jgi:hypothetical protein
MYQGAISGSIGNLVKFESGPAAVIGDEIHKKPLPRIQTRWEGVESRTIRQSEDLP